MSLSEEYDQFMNKYKNGVVLIAFGTNFMPDDERMITLRDVIQKMPD